MTEPKVVFKKLTVYTVGFDEPDDVVQNHFDWLVTELQDKTDLKVADWKVEEWNND
mgnify:FL=1|jgi:hypothetical protein|tara:strand:+ start:314 stop:481 length:168 start_codon:yes stop_codon:yes gene_type:complete